MLTFSFTSGHQNITVHAEFHADTEASVEEVHAEPVAPVHQWDTHGKRQLNQLHTKICMYIMRSHRPLPCRLEDTEES